MTIGGEDYEYLGTVTRDQLWQALVHAWPNGWVEDDDKDPPQTHRLSLYRPKTAVFFVYRDWASCAAWEREGRTDRYAEGMIMVHHVDDAVYFTSEGEGSSKVFQIMDELRTL